VTDKGFVACLHAVLVEDEQCGVVFDPDAIVAGQTFEEAGLLSGNQGLVLRMADGDEYQLTVVRSRRGPGRAAGGEA
jgi:hypothetical protein